jgi:hypothetical protein
MDTRFIKTIIPPQKEPYNHQKGCDKLLKEMEEVKKLNDGFALGIIDKDKKIRKYTEEFVLIAKIEGRLELLKHPKKNHYLIFICPAIEVFILECAKEANVTLEEFNLPPDLEDLRKITKTSVSEDNDTNTQNFKNLFRSFLGARTVKSLINCINYLQKHPYNADKEELKRILGE